MSTTSSGTWRAALGLVAGATTLLAAACAESTASTPAATPATSAPSQAAMAAATPNATTAAAAPSGTSAAAAASSTPARKVSANSASRAELQDAFQAAGISNPANWAREVEEYRPYPTNDPTFAKLRQNLAKYNPGPGVVDGIIATLILQ